ncbi:hypothetical protein Tco_1206980 [Tanacetum coccineum]
MMQAHLFGEKQSLTPRKGSKKDRRRIEEGSTHLFVSTKGGEGSDGVKAVEDMVEDESHLILHLIGDRLCALAMLTKVFMAERCRGWLAIRSMHSNDGSGGGLVVLGSKFSKELSWSRWWCVSGGGVVLRVVSSSVREVLCGAKCVVGGDSRGVDGGATL